MRRAFKCSTRLGGAFLVWGGGLEWAFIEPLLPVPACRTPSGGPEAHPRREIVDALRCIVGCFMPVATMGSSPSYMWKPDEQQRRVRLIDRRDGRREPTIGCAVSAAPCRRRPVDR
ncbi:hypothetical protein [Streptomyces sp. SID685]|uniref:hypothetical protein n=1 Tax=Streptomyces sp. SID685 TaxID=2690322 RepID=UPI0023515563|nr:hypothetical protein [Streptomyces sp. SID685]